MQINLNSHEVGAAVRVGALRHWEAVRGGMADRHGFDGDGWGVHIEGALGEIAAAKALNIYWDGSVNTFKADDLAGIQVRTPLARGLRVNRPPRRRRRRGVGFGHG
jgi:hypothetical protein